MYKANSDVFGKMVQLVVSLFLELISVGRKKPISLSNLWYMIDDYLPQPQ